MKNDASPWRDGKAPHETMHRWFGTGTNPPESSRLKKCRDVVMIQVSHSISAPRDTCFMMQRGEQTRPNLRDYLERKRAAELARASHQLSTTRSPSSPSSSPAGWNRMFEGVGTFGSLFGSNNNGNTANAGKKVMTSNAVGTFQPKRSTRRTPYKFT